MTATVEAGRATPRWREPRTIAVVAVVVVPILVGVVAALGDRWFPASDWALIELRTRDVGSAQTPLVGPFSRFGWNHPGPLMFWLFAPVYRLLGAQPTALLAAAGLWNAAMTAVALVLARRVGGRGFLVLLAIALALLLGALGGEVIINPWNPWIALVPFVVFILSIWGVTGDDLLLVPVAGLTGSFLVQTHVGYAVVVGVLALWAAGFVAVRAAKVRSASRADAAGPAAGDDPSDPDTDAPSGSGPAWTQHRRRLLVTVATTVVACTVAWVGPIVEQFTRSPGNLRMLATHFVRDDSPTAGVSMAGTVLGRALAPLAPWFGGPEPRSQFTAEILETNVLWAVPVLGLFALGFATAWRRRDLLVVRLQATLVVALAAGTIATSRITGEVFFYLVRWWWILAMFVWVSTVWALGRAIDARRVRSLAPHVGVVSLAVLVLVSVTAIDRMLDPITRDHNTAAVAAVSADTAEAIDSTVTYLARPAGFSWFEVFFGVLNRLDDEGVTIVVEDRFRAMFGPERVLADQPLAGTLTVATDDAVPGLLDDPGQVLVAEHDPLTPAERAELELLRARARESLVAAGRDDLLGAVDDAGLQYFAAQEPAIDVADAERIAELLQTGTWVAVFLGPPPEGDLASLPGT